MENGGKTDTKTQLLCMENLEKYNCTLAFLAWYV